MLEHLHSSAPPLMNAIRCNNTNHQEVVDGVIIPLLDAGVDINIRDSINNTALHYAVLDDSSLYVQTFINLGADVHLKDNYGKLVGIWQNLIL